MQTIRASRAVSVNVRASAKPTVSKPMAKLAQLAGVAVSSLALTLAAHADANVKLGSSTGALVFEPETVTISAGESVTFVNNAGFPHNIVFDEDAVPAGVSVDAISREDYMNAPGETYTVKLDTAGEYGFYCEPHQGAGMVGKIIVK
ncbi:chloroplast plastocyanin [Haematococcus lacustris]